MSRKYKFNDNDKLYFISFATVYWIDVFEEKGLEIYSRCIMPIHVHMIIGSKRDKLEYIVCDMKKHTSLALKAAIKITRTGVGPNKKKRCQYVGNRGHFLLSPSHC